MSQQRLQSWRVTLLGVLGLTLLSTVAVSRPAVAQSSNSPNFLQQLLNRINPPRNRNAGAPTGRQFAGARRDLCPLTANPLTALIPSTNLGLTSNEHPTLWFYMPYARPQDYGVEFVLIDPEENDVYKHTFSLPDEPGIISIQLPENGPPLEAGKSYRWVLSVMCNPGNRSGDATVNGWIERIEERDLADELAAATTLQSQLLVYSEHNLWYEILTALAQRRRTEPEDLEIKATWDELLTFSNFNESIIAAPITPCCTAQE